MTVYFVISLPKVPHIHRIYMVLANPSNLAATWPIWPPYGHFLCMPAPHASPLTLISGLSPPLVPKPSITAIWLQLGQFGHHMAICGACQLLMPAPSPSFQASVPPSCQNHYGIMITILSICYHLDILCVGACQLLMPAPSPSFQASVPPSCQNHYGIMITMLSIRSPFCRSVTIWTPWVYASSSCQPPHPHFRPQFFPPAKTIAAL